MMWAEASFHFHPGEGEGEGEREGEGEGEGEGERGRRKGVFIVYNCWTVWSMTVGYCGVAFFMYR